MAVAALCLLIAGCGESRPPQAAVAANLVTVTISGADTSHVFHLERAETAAAQARGLMHRTAIPDDGGMLFAPYPPGGGAPALASIWMKDTPIPLDILFIRADGAIARIADNAVPLSTALVGSGEPVAAIIEIRGGRALDLGISAGDAVDWHGRDRVH